MDSVVHTQRADLGGKSKYGQSSANHHMIQIESELSNVHQRVCKAKRRHG
jgi:hypothetical protein